MDTRSLREFRIGAELRRCCWYVIASLPVYVAVLYYGIRVDEQRPLIEMAPATVGVALVAAVMMIPLRWRLVVDERGIARRRVFGWDRWTWDELANGRILKLHPHTLYDPARPWSRRRMALSSMDSADILEVTEAVNAHYQLPPPPEAPATMTIRYGFRRRATFDAHGIHIMEAGTPHEYDWDDVEYIHLTRTDPLRRDFGEAVVAVPGKTIRIPYGYLPEGKPPSWRSGVAAQLNELILRYVPESHVQVFIHGELHKNRKYVERQLKECRLVRWVLDL